jgi:exodeoxyribonuclease III
MGCQNTPRVDEAPPLRVMTYNVFVGGRMRGQPLEQTARVVRAARADIVIIQERADSGPMLAAELKLHYQEVDKSVAILSRFPIVKRLSHGAEIRTSTTLMAVFGVHLLPMPYGPYDLRDNPDLTEADLVASARKTRGSAMAEVLAEIAPYLAAGTPVFLGGDFNEPSHLDWTDTAASARFHFGRKVEWPTSRSVQEAVLADSYRAIVPDPAKHPAETWTPVQKENEVHDRIDILYHAGRGVHPVQAAIVGEDAAAADIVVTPYPSDHRAVVVAYSIDE